MTSKYRPDIDGLRAIAVLGVVLYHLDSRLCPGGFTGVDIFFVISGYLITSIIEKEIQEKKFSLTRFYERRVRRILPAYFFLLLFTSTMAYLILTPAALSQYAKAKSHSLLFISNFLFSGEVDYFAKTFHASPLLHTWSLAVEEQFYIIWPLLLSFLGALISTRFFKYFFLLFLVTSLIISEVLTAVEPKLAFFMIYSRAWELGIGAVIALPILPSLLSQRQIELFSRIGMLLIACSLLLVNNNSSFPGFTALFAVIGTACVIYSGNFSYQGSIHHFLSLRPLVNIGLISYSLYLWHWPLITFSKYYLGRNLHFMEAPLLGVVSCLFAYFSYRFIEKPFRTSIPSEKFLNKEKAPRSSKTLFPGKKVFITVFSVTSIMLVFSIYVDNSKTLPFRFTHSGQPNLYTGNPLRDACHLSRPQTVLNSKEECSYNQSGKKALLWGDSHADHYMPALKTWTEKNNIELRQVSKSACAPIVGDLEMYRLSDKKYTRYHECESFNNKIMHLIEDEDEGIEIVLLAGRWSHFLSTHEPDIPSQYLLNPSERDPSGETTARIFKRNFKNMLSRLKQQNKLVILLGQVPLFYTDPAECYLLKETPLNLLFSKNSFTSKDTCTAPLKEVKLKLSESLGFFNEVDNHDNVLFFDPMPFFCDTSDCKALQDGKILYQDAHHLNVEGASFLAPFLARISIPIPPRTGN